MPYSDSDIVLGLLFHVGGLSAANQDSRSRVIESIAPVHSEWGIWQARDNYVGASWIIALGADDILQLTSYRADGTCWKEYKPSTQTEIFDTNSDGHLCQKAIIASFHDTKHNLAPPALLRIGKHYVYRNVSGHTVPIKEELVHEIFEINNIK